MNNGFGFGSYAASEVWKDYFDDVSRTIDVDRFDVTFHEIWGWVV
jgi:hypothetical protein